MQAIDDLAATTMGKARASNRKMSKQAKQQRHKQQ
jgi:hypothetical protein